MTHNSTPGYTSLTPKKPTNLKRYMHPNIYSSIITITKVWKQPVSITRKTDKEDVVISSMCVYTHI